MWRQYAPRYRAPCRVLVFGSEVLLMWLRNVKECDIKPFSFGLWIWSIIDVTRKGWKARTARFVLVFGSEVLLMWPKFLINKSPSVLFWSLDLKYYWCDSDAHYMVTLDDLVLVFGSEVLLMWQKKLLLFRSVILVLVFGSEVLLMWHKEIMWWLLILRVLVFGSEVLLMWR